MATVLALLLMGTLLALYNQ